MRIVIEERELIDCTLYLNAEQTILLLLQTKGAPIEGKLYLKIKDGYSVNYHEDKLTQSFIYEFIENK